MKKFILIDPDDTVVVALEDMTKGDVIFLGNRSITLNEDVAMGHKIAVQDIAKGERILKYGQPIGHALRDIRRGDWVHTHNLDTDLIGLNVYSYQKTENHVPIDLKCDLTFQGYIREDGSVGIRNELWIIPTVGCVTGMAQQMAERLRQAVDCSRIDGIHVFSHPYGCSQLGEDLTNTARILGDFVKHPNAGGVLVLGLGCEHNHVAGFRSTLGDFNEKRVRFLVAQEVQDEVEEGVRLLTELYANMLTDKKKDVPISKLKVGLKCGGSDGLSGITANPLLGYFADWLVERGGTTVLSEVPEMFGAETLLMNRCVNRNVFVQMVNLINGFKKYFIEHNQPIYENPAPGNKEGGITTLEEKSLGCIRKGGYAPVMDVLPYGAKVQKKGLNILCAPGNDLVSSTALAAAGCQMILFTTGRGTPFGCAVPTVKVSTNSGLYRQKPHWIDFNAGILAEGGSMATSAQDLADLVLQVANGQDALNEKNGFREIAIFKSGVTV